MVWRPPQLSHAQMEERRLAAAQRLRTGRLKQAEIARGVGVGQASVTRWKQQLAGGGVRALHRRRASGRASYSTPAEWRQGVRVRARAARRAGFETEQWTLPRIALVIEQHFGIRYHPRSLGRALRARGWSPQRPIARAPVAPHPHPCLLMIAQCSRPQQAQRNRIGTSSTGPFRLDELVTGQASPPRAAARACDRAHPVE